MAQDEEMAVLGAIILQSQSFLKVHKTLRPQHFYQEAHKEIFAACVALNNASTPIDMLSIVFHLRQAGKIELVGGSSYIAELTSRVTSSANIEHHAKIIIQQSIKRDLILLASKIHQEAYDDTSDVLDLLPRSIDEITFIQNHNIKSSEKDLIQEQWKSLLITTEPPEVQPMISITGTPIATPGNHSLLVGKKKSRKSLFVTYEMAELFRQHPYIKEDEVAIFDTEQGKRHVWKSQDRIKRLTGRTIPIFYLRGMSPSERRDFIKHTCQHWPKKLRLIVIDGIRDLLSNINDPDECTEVIVWVEKLILTHDIHLQNILHLNKTDNNARGHLGSELLNKAEVTIELELDDKTGCSLIKCESSREKPFETFAFTHGEDGLPMLVDAPIQGKMIPQDTRRKMLIQVFEDGEMNYKPMVEKIKTVFDVGENKAGKLVQEFRTMGWIGKFGKDRDPKTIYRLLIDDVKAPIAPIAVNGVQNEPIKHEVFDPGQDLPF
jgi:hypothetical protein